MGRSPSVEKACSPAPEVFGALGVDTEAGVARLDQVPISRLATLEEQEPMPWAAVRDQDGDSRGAPVGEGRGGSAS